MAGRSSSDDAAATSPQDDGAGDEMVEVDVADVLDGLDDPDLDEADIDASELEGDLDTLDDDIDDIGDGDEDVAVLPEEADDDLDTSELVAAVATAAEVFDDEDLATVVEDADDDDLDGIREGEFVCRSCYLAKRDTQLADAKAMLCRDCA
ncbi:MAG: hypothetical protein WD576_03925 [Nitriliruptoraceae bacterium]